MTTPSCSVLVPSCDSYADVWPPFFSLLHRHWPDCPFPVYLGSNFRGYESQQVKSLLVGEDRSWSFGLRQMLERLDTTYVLIILEDFLLRSSVDTARILRLARELDELSGAYLRLRPYPTPDVRLARFPLIGEIEPGAPYRASMQAAIWRRESLLELLRDEENPWQMEVFGARRSDEMRRGFYSTWEPALDYYAGVAMGRWIPYGLALCREQGVAVELKARPTLSPRDAAKRNAGRVLNVALDQVPWKVRERVRRWVRATGLLRRSS